MALKYTCQSSLAPAFRGMKAAIVAGALIIAARAPTGSIVRYSVVVAGLLAGYNLAAWLAFGARYPWRALSARANVLLVSELIELLGIWLLYRFSHPGRNRWERAVRIVMTPVYAGTLLALPCGLLLADGGQVNSLILLFYLCGGISLQFAFYCLLCHGISLGYRCLSSLHHSMKFDCAFLGRGFLRTALPLALTVGMTTVGLLNVKSSAVSGIGDISVRRLDIQLSRLPKSLSGLQVALVSDLHIGPTVGAADVAALTAQLNRLQPDVVALVGDLADTPGSGFLTAVEPLSNVRAKLAKFYVTGNHEYLTMKPDAWIRAVRAAGFQPLGNQARRIAGSICFAGVNDQFADVATGSAHLHYNLSAALSGCQSTDAVVLLAHQPSVAKDAISTGANVDLVLCGHTHAGQFFPLTLLAGVVFPFNYGYYRLGPYQVYVTSGAMYYGPPIRTFTRQEIALIRLL